MTNVPRRKGTSAESQVVAWLQAHGQPYVERHSLHGSRDLGDVQGVAGLAISVKFVGKGKPLALSGWLNDLQGMRVNENTRRAHLPPANGILVVRRPGYPDVGDWYAIERFDDWWSRYESR